MTTWEPATKAEKREISLLLERARRGGVALPQLPATATEPDLAGLTRRDAGKVVTLLRETLAEASDE